MQQAAAISSNSAKDQLPKHVTLPPAPPASLEYSPCRLESLGPVERGERLVSKKWWFGGAHSQDGASRASARGVFPSPHWFLMNLHPAYD